MENIDSANLSQSVDSNEKSQNKNAVKIIIGGLIFTLFLLVGAMGMLVYTSVDSIKNKDNEISHLKRDLNDAKASSTPSLTISPSTSVTSPTTTSTVKPTATPISTNVKVYFSKDPSSYDNPTIIVAVNRSTTRSDVGTFSIEELINGPTSTEQIQGLFTPIKLSGSSNCGGANFQLNISAKKATLKFCKIVDSAGVGADARVRETATKTLSQFSTIEKIVILDRNDNCFGDMSGLNLCK